MKTCLVITGAAGELGRIVMAAALARADVDHVIATTRRKPIVDRAAGLTSLAGVDLGREDGVETLRAAVDAVGDRRIGLVHCAGGFPPASPIHRVALDEIAATFASNTLSFLGAARAVLPSMRRVREGRLVAFTSHTQHAAYPYLGPFNLSKAALLSAVQTMANENARHGVAVNAVAVATLQTETERQIKPAGSYEDWVPVGDVADYVIRLATREPIQVNGNELHYWNYSRSFFEDSIFERNSLDHDILDDPRAS